MTRILWSLFAHTSTNTLTHSHAHICFDLHSKQTTHTHHTIEVRCLSLFSHKHTHSLFLAHSLLCFSHTLSCVWHIVYLSLSFSFYLSLSLSHTHTSTSTCTCVHSRSQTLKQKSLFLIPTAVWPLWPLTVALLPANSSHSDSLLHKLNSLASLLCVT